MLSGATPTLDKHTSFVQEIEAQSAIRKERRKKISQYPSLSVVLSTLRSDDLESILKQIQAQSLKRFELVIGLHTIDLEARHKTLITKLKKRGISVVVMKFSKEATLGTILSDLAKVSSGEYVSKMDDDDFYGPEHLQDLLDAAIATKAEVVGRAMNYVYLEPIDVTVRRFNEQGTQAVELWSDWVCGGTILVTRAAGEKAGWFGTGTTAVDRQLLSQVTAANGKIWRTFGAGYIYRRTFTFHTYVTNYSKYLKNANQQVVGLWDHAIFGAGK